MVDRYKKSGGFVQLLQVIETCGPKKYDQFMGIITEEDPSWAEAIKEKMLTFDKILDWQPEILLEVLANVNSLAFCTALKGIAPDLQNKFLSALSHQERRKLEQRLDDIKPNANEISSCVMKVVSETRALLTAGTLKAAKIDQALVIPEAYEEKLSLKNSLNPTTVTTDSTYFSDTETSGTSAVAVGSSGFAAGTTGAIELDKLQKKLVILTREYQIVKQENSVLKDKLEKIKKIA